MFVYPDVPLLMLFNGIHKVCDCHVLFAVGPVPLDSCRMHRIPPNFVAENHWPGDIPRYHKLCNIFVHASVHFSGGAQW